jgi:hypothetical protein
MPSSGGRDRNAANADVLSRREVANLTGHEYQPPGIMSW